MPLPFHNFGPLQSPDDLLEKLRHDLARMHASPGDVDAAIGFFVTADHLVDWLWPGPSCSEMRAEQRSSHALLEVTSALARGSRHFVVDTRLHVNLDGRAATEFGPRIDAERLAMCVIEYWQETLKQGISLAVASSRLPNETQHE